MTLSLQEILTIAEARLLSKDVELSYIIRSGFASDLMSDVLRYDIARGLLVTGLANPQVVRTAEMADAAAILMVRGKIPPPETIELAQRIGIPVLSTELIMFETCGRLFAAGLKGGLLRTVRGK